jgi:hypothetical protein
MATVNLSRTLPATFGVGIIWTPLANGDDGQAWDTQDFPDISFQVVGTFGSGGTLLIEGSNEVTPTNWATLNDPQANALSFTSAKIEQLLELPRWVRPRVSAGDGTTSLTVNVWAGRRR